MGEDNCLAVFRMLSWPLQTICIVVCNLSGWRSRALAALLKELSKTGLREVAFEIFDWLRSLDEQMHPEYVGLLDVFTYTTMIVSSWPCDSQQYSSKASRPGCFI